MAWRQIGTLAGAIVARSKALARANADEISRAAADYARGGMDGGRRGEDVRAGPPTLGGDQRCDGEKDRGTEAPASCANDETLPRAFDATGRQSRTSTVRLCPTVM